MSLKTESFVGLLRIVLLTLASAALVTPHVALAQAAVPTVAGSPLLFIQRGRASEVTLTGQRLANVDRIALLRARGLDVSIVPPAKDVKRDADTLRLKLTADADAALGEREARLVGPLGVSAPLRVTVGQYPAVEEKEPNNTPEQAQDVTFPATLVGRIDGGGDVDNFRFQAAKGATLVFDIHAMRAGSSLDPVFTMHDEAGRELSTRRELHGGDPTLLFDVPADARYVLSIRDLQYRGGADYGYRIDAGAIPYVQALLPMTAQAGRVAEVKTVGVNLSGAEKVPLDLTYAATSGEVAVRARTPGGVSNPVNVELNDLPAFVDEHPVHAAASAVAVPMPVDITGRIDAAGDENFFKFHVPRKGIVTLAAIARRMGSPMDALLTLRNPQGAAIQTVDDSAGPDATISRELDAGDYVVSVRDLFFNGGANFGYRLQIRAGASRAQQQGFSVRFLPDAPRVSRGGSAVVFVDLQRAGDFKGDVTITLEDLPPGVTCPPLVMNEKLPGASGMLVLSAAADAAMGSVPIRLRASGIAGGQLVARDGTPMLGTRAVEQAYLTVLDAAPLTIEALTDLPTGRVQQLSAEADALAAKLAASNAQLEAAQAQWEQKVGGGLVWEPLTDGEIASAGGTTFSRLDDGSILAAPSPSPERDTYTLTVPSDVAGITAFRLEVIPDPSLPSKGPGRNVAGNFVLSHLTVSVAPQSDPEKKTPVMLTSPRADFEQAGYPVIDAIQPKPGKGWAMFPRGGTANEAVFFTNQPIGDHAGAIFTFTLDQQFGQQHTLGRFRWSITTDPQTQVKAGIPAEVAKALYVPLEKRSPDQKAQVSAYYRTIDPQLAANAERLKMLREVVGPLAEEERLEAALKSPDVDAQREPWEKAAATGAVWLPLDITSSKSQNGATLTKQPDGSVFVSGAAPATDAYTLTGTAPFGHITALRIEALPDPRLPATGPGRAPNGNFVLTKVLAFASPMGAPEMTPPIEFKSAHGSFEQQNYPAAGALDEKDETGWGILPNAGKPANAVFVAAEHFGASAGTAITLVLEHRFASSPQHALGRFRVWATSQRDPESALTPLPDVVAALRVAPDKRNPKQKDDLTAYFRTISPALDPIRQRLAELKVASASHLTIARNKDFTIPFLLNRAAAPGDVKVSLEGFVTARDPNTAAPAPIATALKLEPLTISVQKPAGDVLKAKVEGGATAGSRYCVLRAETTVGDDTRVEYSAPFVLTVLEK